VRGEGAETSGFYEELFGFGVFGVFGLRASGLTSGFGFGL
jgi:hypothetical protein